MKGADPSQVSVKARKRGRPQLGTLGSGNHFLEIQRVEEIYDEAVAKKIWPVQGPDYRYDPLRLAGSRPPDLHRPSGGAEPGG